MNKDIRQWWRIKITQMLNKYDGNATFPPGKYTLRHLVEQLAKNDRSDYFYKIFRCFSFAFQNERNQLGRLRGNLQTSFFAKVVAVLGLAQLTERVNKYLLQIFWWRVQLCSS